MNAFLGVAHNADGTLNTAAVQSALGGSIAVIDIRNYVTGGVEKTSDTTRDDSAAFTAAIAACAAYGDGTRRPAIYLAPGYYNVHAVSIANTVTFFGSLGYYNTIVRYNGAGGAGSSLFTMDIPNPGTSALAAGLFRNLSLQGYNGNTNGHVAENILKWTTTVGVDWGLVFDYVHMGFCFGDAIKFVAGQASSLTNLHAGPMRFDQIGGYAISLDATGSSVLAQRDIEFSKLTMDSRKPNGNFSNATQADAVWDGSAGWGKGLANLVECGGATVAFRDGRIEINGTMVSVSSVRQLIRVSNSQTYSTKVRFKDIVVNPQSADALVIVNDVGTTPADVSWEGPDFDGRCKLLQSATASPTNDLPTNGMLAPFIATPSQGGIQGIVLGGRKIEFRTALPSTSVNVDYQAGDTIINSAPGSAVDGWVCYSPTTGFSNPQTANQATSATWGTSNGVVTPASATSLRLFPIGMNVILVGGGAAGVDLNCRVTAVDPAAGTFTVNVTPSTAKAGIGSIKYQNPVWRQLGVSRLELAIIGQGYKGESFDRGTSGSTLLLVSDTAYFSAVGLKAGDVVTNVICDMETTGVKGASGAAYVGLYSSTGAQLAVSADATTQFTGAAGNLVVPLSAAYTVPADGLYYLAVYSNFATTQPTLFRGNGGGNPGVAVGSGARKFARQVASGSLASLTSATLANGSVHIWLAWS